MDLGGVGVHGRGGSGGGGGGSSGDEGVATADAAVWWGPKAAVVAAAAASASADVMNQLCRVCGEPAAGFHFGAFTCEGCKSFFGRTYSNLSSISECKNNGECVINKKNRTSCKACRLRKCLLVGMSKSGSRYGRRSNWFKIHCLLQEQQQQQQQATAAGSAAGSAMASAKGLWPIKVDGEATKGYQPEAKNAPPASPPRAPPPPLPQPLAVGGFPDAATASAAAFWAQARGSLLQLPTPHISGLHMPFLTPPFLHGAAGFSPYQHKGFLLPFLPASTAPASTTTPPRPSRPASPAKRELPAAALSDRRTSASSSDEDSPPPGPALLPPPAPAVRVSTPATAAPSAAVTAAAAAAAAALAVESLRALGPMQETPLDLSFRGGNTSVGGASSDGGAASDATENDSGEDNDRDSCEDDERSEDMDASEDGPQSRDVLDGTNTVKRTTPLDLTTHA